LIEEGGGQVLVAGEGIRPRFPPALVAPAVRPERLTSPVALCAPDSQDLEDLEGRPYGGPSLRWIPAAPLTAHVGYQLVEIGCDVLLPVKPSCLDEPHCIAGEVKVGG
jgi:hypothetical protein